jgi:hypothetical protein
MTNPSVEASQPLAAVLEDLRSARATIDQAIATISEIASGAGAASAPGANAADPAHTGDVAYESFSPESSDPQARP